jgi:hypothetical protein
LKDRYLKRNLWTKTLILWIVILLILNCSGSKDYDETPMPIGGDEKVRSVFLQVFGRNYYDLSGSRVRFLIEIDKDGEIDSISEIHGFSKNLNDTLIRAMKDYIKFTPATKNGERVKAKFYYTFFF